MPSVLSKARFHSAFATSVGMVREHNEDRVVCNPSRGLFAVADGMGGHAAGEVASRLAVDTIAIRLDSSTPAPEQALVDAFRQADATIRTRASRNPRSYFGMGTTLVALFAAGKQWIVAHTGDSRCYQIGPGDAVRLTRDHKDEGGRITRCLGGTGGEEWRWQPEVSVLPMTSGDTFVLCSDGISDLMAAEEIASIVNTSFSRFKPDTAAQKASEGLVGIANSRGGRDNSSAVVVRLCST